MNSLYWYESNKSHTMNNLDKINFYLSGKDFIYLCKSTIYGMKAFIISLSLLI